MSVRQRITFEYVLLRDVNDSLDDARRLVKLLNGLRCKVNLLPFNEIPESPYRRPADDTVQRFWTWLVEHGVSASVRRSRGRDISAACGQLCYAEQPAARLTALGGSTTIPAV